MLVFFALLFPLALPAAEQYNKNFSFELRDVTVKDVFRYIEKNSEYVFLYASNKNLSKKVNVDVKDKNVKQILNEVLEHTGLVYEIDGKQIIVKEPKTNVQAVLQQQKGKTVKGQVLDKTGETIIGANVVVDGTTNGVMTNIDGRFELSDVPENGKIKVTFVGYKAQVISVKGKKELNIVLEEDTEMLSEVVVVGYGSQKKESLVGSVQMVKPEQLKVPSSNLSSGFAGRLAGVVAVQRSGEPGADGADFWIRGVYTFSGMTSPLIVIDGVEASSGDLNALDPEVIEGFSILKDATATALYGSRGANGVMIVTTKSGRNQEKATINFRLENTYNTPIQVPEFVDGVRYMEMFNEAVTTRGTGEVLYPQSKIDGTRAGLDPYAFPNVDWYDELFRKGAMNQNFNFNIRGGSQRIDYFSSVSINHDSGVLKNNNDFSYDNNINIMRYVFQNNINAHLSKTSTLSLRLNVQLRDYNGPHSSAKEVYGMVMEANPVDFPVRWPSDPTMDYILWGGKSGGAYNNGYRNPYAEMARGYKSQFYSTVVSNLKFDQKLDFITQGLSANVLFSFKNWSQTQTKRWGGYNQFEVDKYQYDDAGNYTGYTLRRVGKEQDPTLSTESESTGDRRIYLQAMINYDRTFGSKHNVNAMLLYNQDQYNVNNPGDLIASLPQRKQGLAGRLTYSYDYRYLAEFNFGYNGSENFAEGHRFGFFPSFALGYTISREKWFEPLNDVITNLKIRGSWGLVGNDQIGAERYIYMSNIELQNEDMGFTTGKDQNTTYWGPKYLRYPNPSITWEVGSKFNIGLDLSLFNDFNLALDVFKEVRSDIFMERQSIPNFIGTSPTDPWFGVNLSTKLYGNLGKVENKGLDFSIDYNHAFNKDFSMSFKGTFTYATNKVLEYDEPDYQAHPNLSRVGHSINQQLLYIADRLFIDDEEVANSPKQNLGGFVQAGDIKYKDIPNAEGVCDGVIDANDRVYTGHPTVPEIVYGFGPSFQYKKWDFSCFFQGVARTSIVVGDIHPFGTDGLRNVQKFIADDYWSESNQNIYAAYPRLSKQYNPNNTVASTYWLRNGAFLKLKDIELGYSFKLFRVYMRGSNLLTFSPFDLWDPEQGSGNGLFYPTQKSFNVGIQFSLNK